MPSDVVALKRISKQRAGKEATDPALNEYIIMKSLKHPVVIAVGGMVDSFDALYIELELADGGDLFKAISPDTKGLDEPLARRHMRDLCAGLAFIHSKNVVHSDIKPENILVSGGRAKLADFGLAAHHGVMRAHPAVGTAPYMAPELVDNTLSQYVVHTSHDVWGFAIILYAVFFADLPWENAMVEDADYAKFLRKRATLNLYPFPLLSVPIKELFQAMLSEEPELRPSAATLHDFFDTGRAWFRSDVDSDVQLDLWLQNHKGSESDPTSSTMDIVCKFLTPLSSIVNAVSW